MALVWSRVPRFWAFCGCKYLILHLCEANCKVLIFLNRWTCNSCSKFNYNRLFMAPHLISTQGAYKGYRCTYFITLICTRTRTHAHMHIHTLTLPHVHTHMESLCVLGQWCIQMFSLIPPACFLVSATVTMVVQKDLIANVNCWHFVLFLPDRTKKLLWK